MNGYKMLLATYLQIQVQFATVHPKRVMSHLLDLVSRQSRGVLLMEAENNSQNANGLSSFLSGLERKKV